MKRGVYLSILTAVISGVSIWTNSFFVSTLNPLVFAVTRNMLVACLLTMLVLTTGTRTMVKALSIKSWLKLILIGAIGGGIPFALFFTGLADVGAVNGNIIQKTLFLWVALLAVPVLHERVSKIQFIGYLTLLLGMFVFGGTFRVVPKMGTWFILGATVLWAIEQVVAKVTLRDIHPMIVSWGRIVFGLPFLIVAGVVTDTLHGPTIAGVMFSAPVVVSSVLLIGYMMSWYGALSKAPATLVSSVLVVAPVVTAILNGLVSHKLPAHDQAVSLLFLSLGTFLILVERIYHTKNVSTV